MVVGLIVILMLFSDEPSGSSSGADKKQVSVNCMSDVQLVYKEQYCKGTSCGDYRAGDNFFGKCDVSTPIRTLCEKDCQSDKVLTECDCALKVKEAEDCSDEFYFY